MLTDEMRQTISKALDYVIQDICAHYQNAWCTPPETVERHMREDTELNKLIDAKRLIDSMTGAQLVPFSGHVTDDVFVTSLQLIHTRQDGRDVAIRLPRGFTVAKWVDAPPAAIPPAIDWSQHPQFVQRVQEWADEDNGEGDEAE